MPLHLTEKTLSDLISTKEASEYSGYSSDYLARLCRTGIIHGTQVAHVWLVEKKSLDSFIERQAERKEALREFVAHEREKEYKRATSTSAKNIPNNQSLSNSSPEIISRKSVYVPTHHRPLAAAAVALLVVAGSAYASTSSSVQRALNTVPGAIEHTVLALYGANALFIPATNLAQDDTHISFSAPHAIPLHMPNAMDMASTIAYASGAPENSYAAGWIKQARTPFEKTDAAYVARGRVALVQAAIQDPQAFAVKTFYAAIASYVQTGHSINTVTNNTVDAYVAGIAQTGTGAVNTAGAAHDAGIAIADIPSRLLDTYAAQVYAYVDTAPRIAEHIVFGTYLIGDTLARAVSTTQQRSVDTVASARDVAGESLFTLAERASGTSLALVPKESYLSNTVATAEPVFIDSISQSPSSASLTASVANFAPITWQRSVLSVGTNVVAFLEMAYQSSVRAIATTLGIPGFTSSLAVIPFENASTMMLPTPADAVLVAAYGVAGSPVASLPITRTVIQNFYPQTTVVGQSDEAILALIRPYVLANINRVADRRGGGGISGDGAELSNVSITGGTATLSSATIQTATIGTAVIGTSTIANLSASTTNTDQLTASSASVTNNLNVGGTLTAASLSVGSLSSAGGIIAPFFTATDTNATSSFTNLTGTNAVFQNSTTTNFYALAATITDAIFGTITSNLATITSAVITNLSGTNSNFSNATSTNLFATNGTIANLTGTNSDFVNSSSTNFTATNATTTNASSTNLFAANGVATNLQTTNLNATNANIASGTINNLIGTNSTFTNGTTTNASSTNAFATNGTFTNILATNATTTNFYALAATITDAIFGTITSNLATLATAVITNLTATNGTITNLSGTNSNFANATSTNATSTNLFATNGSITTLVSSFATIASAVITNLTATNGTIANLTGTNSNFTNGTTTNATSTNLFANNGVVTTLIATNATTTNATSTNFFATNGVTTNLQTTNVTATNANIASGTIANLSGTNSTFSNGTTTNATSTNLFATNGTFTNLRATNATTTNFYALAATITDAIFGTITSNLATLATAVITNLTATNGTIANLSGTNTNFTNGTTTNATSTNLSATNGSITTLVSNLATIASAVITNLTATNGTIANLTGTNSGFVNSSSTNLSAINATTTNATSTNFFTTNGVTTNLQTTNVTATNATIASGTIAILTGTNSAFINGTTTNATSTNFYALAATITDAIFGTITSNLATLATAVITNLTATNGTIANLTGTNSTFTNATSTNATSTNAFSTNGTFTNLRATNATTTALSTTNLGLGGSTFISFLGNGLVNSGGTLAVSTTSLASGFFQQGGNSFGAIGVLGTNDAQALQFKTNNATVGTFLTNGNFGIGTTSPSERLSVAGNALISGSITAASLTTSGTTTVAGLSIGSLSGFLKATAGSIGTSLINLSTDVSSTLPYTRGGTGFSSFTVGDILYADSGGALTKLPVGAAGQVLKVQAGLPSWGADQTIGSGGTDGIFATSSGRIYPLNTSDILLIGTNATTTANSIMEVNGQQYISSRLAIATTTPSPLAALAVNGNALFSGSVSAGSLTLAGSNFTSLLGTGLINNGGLLSVSTSSLGLVTGVSSVFGRTGAVVAQSGDYSTTLVTEGTNLYYTDTRARNAISSSALGLTYTAGTGTFSLTSGYTIPLTASTTNWNTFYDTPSTRIAAGNALTWAGNTLNVSTTSLASGFFQQNGNAFATLATLGTTDNQPLRFITNNTERVRIDALGNVGIGSTSPMAKLSVVGDAVFVNTSATGLVVGQNGTINPAFVVDTATASSVTGLRVKSAAVGGGLALSVTSSAVDEALTFTSKGNGNISFINGNGAIAFNINGGNVLQFNRQIITWTPQADNSTIARFGYTGAADTSLTASTEAPIISFNLAQTRQHQTGALTLQRDFRIDGATDSFVAASVLTDAATLGLTYKSAGANATVTNSSALFVPTRALTGTITNSYGLNITAATGATNNYAAVFSGGSVGIATTTPGNTLTVAGSFGLTGAFADRNYSTGTLGQLLQTNGTGVQWVSTSTLGFAPAGSGVLSFNGRTGAVVPTSGDYTTTLVTEGTNLYYTDTRVNSYINASSTIPKTYTGNFFSASQSFTGGLTTTGLTINASTFTSLLGNGLVNNAGVLSVSTTSLASGFFQQNGNSFGGLATLGTNDAQSLAFETSGVERLRVDAAGNVGIGTTSPGSRFTVEGNSYFGGNTTIGSTSSQTLTFNSGSWVYNNNVVTSRNFGIAPTGTSLAMTQNVAFTGAANGSSDVRSLVSSLTASGANPITQMLGSNAQLEIQTTAGNTINAINNLSYVRLGLLGAGGGSVTNAIVFDGHVANEGPSTMGMAVAFNASGIDLLDGTGSVGSAYGFRAGDHGNATRITTVAAGFFADDQTAGAPITAGFLSGVNSGTNKFGFYATGSANNVFMGNTGFGNVSPTTRLDVRLDANSADSVPVRLLNGSGSNFASVTLDLDPTGNGIGVRSAQITATTTLRNTTDLLFKTSSSAAPLERMRITAAGNVGIGTSSPFARLSVTGDVAVTGGIFDTSATRGTSGQLLSSTGTGTQWISSSALGLTTTNVAEGTNLYYTDARVNSYINASSTIPKTYTGNFFTALQSFSGGISTGSFTLSANTFTNLLGNGLVNNAGVLSVSTTSLASGFFQQNGNSFGTTATLGTNDNNPLVFKTNNAEAMRILTNGNVGIGTLTPGARLDISTSTASGTSDILQKLTWGGDANNWGMRLYQRHTGSALAYDWTIRNGNTTDINALTFLPSGRVGIGTTSPSSLLDIRGSAPVFTLDNTALGSSDFLLRAGVLSIGAFDIFDRTTNQTMFSIQSNQQVLIGTTTNFASNPSRLFVYGGANGSNIDVMGEPVFGRDQAVIELQTSNWDTQLTSTFLRQTGPANAGIGTLLGLPLANLGELTFANVSAAVIQVTGTSSPLVFGMNGTERMRLTTSGNLGIGTTTPGNTLTVAGSFGLTGAFADRNYSTGTLGQLLQTTGTGVQWVSTSTLGLATSNNAGANNQVAYFNGANSLTSASNFTYNGTNLAVTGGSISAGTQFVAPIGTVGAPSYSFATDLTTGIFRPTTGIIALANSGVERMRLDNSGNLGIGTTSPSQVLSVQGNALISGNLILGNNSFSSLLGNGLVNSAGVLSVATSSLASGFFQQNGNSFGTTATLGTNDSNALVFETNNIERLRVSATGNIGIGTANPASKLDIASSTVTGTSDILQNYTWSNDATNWGMRMYQRHTGSALVYDWTIRNGTATDINALTILSNGNIGIGTTTPGRLLTVSGTNTTGLTALRLTNTSVANNITKFIEQEFFGTDTAGTEKRVGAIRFTPNESNYVGSNLSLVVRGSDADVTGLTILSGGNVGIGSTTPGYKLGVTGSASFGGSVGSNRRADFDANGNLTIFQGDNGLRTVLTLTNGGVTAINQGTSIQFNNSSTTAALPAARISAISEGDFSSGLTSLSGLAVFTAGTSGIGERMRITNSGFVGIGTTTPTERLSVAGNVNIGGALNTGNGVTTGDANLEVGGLRTGIGNAYIDLHTAAGTDFESRLFRAGSTNGDLSLVNTGTGNILFQPGGTTALTLNGLTKHVGIGIAPSTRFQVNDGTDANLRVFTGSLYGAGYSGIALQSANDSGNALGMLVLGGSTTIFPNGNVGIGTSTPGSKLDIQSANDGTDTLRIGSGGSYFGFARSSVNGSLAIQGTQVGFNNIVLAPTSGNVGIGTTTPIAKLEVNGPLAVTGTALYPTGATGKGVYLLGSYSDGTRFQGGSTGYSLWYDGTNYKTGTDGGSNGGAMIQGTGASDVLSFYTVPATGVSQQTLSPASLSAYERMTITQVGNVGIGTTTPTAQLHTTGTVRFSNFGAGTLTTDASGNVTASSDERLKNTNGSFDRGLADIQKLSPILYHWNSLSGLDKTTQYAGFSAQNVQTAIPEAVDVDPRGFLALQDRPILAASINAIKELAGRTDLLSVATTTLGTQVTAMQTEWLAAQSAAQMPRALTATQVTAETMAITQDATASRFIVPASAETFTMGSSSVSMSIPAEALTAGGAVNLYKLASYGAAGVQALATRADLLAVRIDSIENRITALETVGAVAQGTVGLTLTTIKSALASLGLFVENGVARIASLVTEQLVLTADKNGNSTAGTVVIPAGETEVVVQNAFTLTTSKIFVTFTGSVQGSWYITNKQQGSFTVQLAQAQSQETSFDYFIVQTEGQVASVGSAPPPPPATPPAAQPTPPIPVAPAGNAPTVTLNGAAAIQIAQGGSWSDPGATARAADGTDISSSIAVSGGVNISAPGAYTITYRATDAAGISGEVSRMVTVLAPSIAPIAPPAEAPAPIATDPGTPPPAPTT